MTLILSNSPTDPIRFADFSNNAVVTLSPSLSGPIIESNSDGTGGCYKYDAVFKMLQICLFDINQRVELPTQYNGVNLSQFNNQYGQNQYYCDSVKKGNILTVDMYPLTWLINDTLEFYKHPLNLYFGLTDNTKLYDSGNAITAPAALNQILDMPPPFVWSTKYNEWTLKTPASGVTETITSTIGFDNENLIQIYAGADNIPYTSDDIIVYAPNFWDRIYINVVVN